MEHHAYVRFSTAAYVVSTEALRLAVGFGDDHVGVEHLLLATINHCGNPMRKVRGKFGLKPFDATRVQALGTFTHVHGRDVVHPQNHPILRELYRAGWAEVVDSGGDELEPEYILLAIFSALNAHDANDLDFDKAREVLVELGIDAVDARQTVIDALDLHELVCAH